MSDRTDSVLSFNSDVSLNINNCGDNSESCPDFLSHYDCPKSIEELANMINENVNTTIRVLKLITYSRRKMFTFLASTEIDELVDAVKVTINLYWKNNYREHNRYASFDHGHPFDPKDMQPNIYRQFLSKVDLDEEIVRQILQILPQLKTPLPEHRNDSESQSSIWEIEAGPELELERPPSNVYPDPESVSDEDYLPQVLNQRSTRKRGRPKTRRILSNRSTYNTRSKSRSNLTSVGSTFRFCLSIVHSTYCKKSDYCTFFKIFVFLLNMYISL